MMDCGNHRDSSYSEVRCSNLVTDLCCGSKKMVFFHLLYLFRNHEIFWYLVDGN